MEKAILLGFYAGLLGLIVGILIGWGINAVAGATILIPGTCGMLIAALLGSVTAGIAAVSAERENPPAWLLFGLATGVTCGTVMPVAIGQLLRLNYREKMAAPFGNHRWMASRVLLGGVLLVLGLSMLTRPAPLPDKMSIAEYQGAMLATIATWLALFGGGLFLIRNGTKRRERF